MATLYFNHQFTQVDFYHFHTRSELGLKFLVSGNDVARVLQPA